MQLSPKKKKSIEPSSSRVLNLLKMSLSPVSRLNLSKVLIQLGQYTHQPSLWIVQVKCNVLLKASQTEVSSLQES